jgi:hypothetical protein
MHSEIQTDPLLKLTKPLAYERSLTNSGLVKIDILLFFFFFSLSRSLHTLGAHSRVAYVAQKYRYCYILRLVIMFQYTTHSKSFYLFFLTLGLSVLSFLLAPLALSVGRDALTQCSHPAGAVFSDGSTYDCDIILLSTGYKGISG